MIYLYKIEKQLNFEDFVFPYGKLNENNIWNIIQINFVG